MIMVTGLSGEKFYLNPGLIEVIEMVPDTLITMSNGRKHLVREPARMVAAGIEDYRVKILSRSMDPLNLCADIGPAQGEPDDLKE